jgi:hypothetical protein
VEKQAMSERSRPESERPTPEGLLYVEVDSPPELEGEFHAWYNTEHIPERLGIRGFVTGRRYSALEGAPRWLAAYELEGLGVLESREYLDWLGPLQTAWTRRILASTRVHRSVFRLAHRADSTLPSKQGEFATGLLAVCYEAPSVGEETLRGWHDGEFCLELLQIPGVLRASRYDSAEGASQLVLYDLGQPWVVQDSTFGQVWKRGWDERRKSLVAYRRTLYVRIF